MNHQRKMEAAIQKLVEAVSEVHELLASDDWGRPRKFSSTDIPVLTLAAKEFRFATPQLEGMAETCDGLVRMIRKRTI